jgi:hypothetical protein
MHLRLEPSRIQAPPSFPLSRETNDSPRELAARFPPSALAGQFVLCRDAAFIPPSWHTRELGSWKLGVHPILPVVTLQTSDGAPIGWLVGYAIAPTGRMVTDRLTVPCTRPVWCDAFEDAIYTLGGRWIALLLTRPAQRVYLDAAGSMAAVYSPAHQMVSSTTTLVPYSRGCDDDVDLLRAVGIPDRNALLPFGLTSRKRVSRVLPNHYLDLDEWATRRHWPVDPLVTDVDPERAATRVAAVVKRHVAAVVAARSAYAALTAGYDSRMIVACAREHVDRLQMITFDLPEATARIDCEVATHLARQLRLSHRVLPFVEPTREQLDEWVWRTGSEIGETRGRAWTATYRRLDPSRAEITGQAGELCRASYWRAARRPRDASIDDILRVLEVPATPRMIELAAQWVRGVRARDTIQLYDFLYIEQWLGCWAGVLPYAEPTATAFRLYPLVHRETFTQMLRLPNEWKVNEQFPKDVIRAQWPELLRAPFNRLLGPRHYMRQVKRRVWKTRRRVNTWARAVFAG